MTEFGFIADSRHTLRANGLQVLFMDGEVRAAKSTTFLVVLANPAAGRTANYRGVIKALLRYVDQFSAYAVKFFSTCSPGSVILTLAVIAAHQNVHNRN